MRPATRCAADAIGLFLRIENIGATFGSAPTTRLDITVCTALHRSVAIRATKVAPWPPARPILRTTTLQRDGVVPHEARLAATIKDMSDPERPSIDPLAVRRLFERPRAALDDFIARETARRMFERCEAMRIAPARVLDAGCGSGADLAPLRARFRDAAVIGVDAAPERIAQARSAERAAQGRFARMLRRPSGASWVAGDFAALPFAPQAFDVIWSNLALHWADQPHRVLPEWRRVMKIGGLVMFSVFGPDTLAEVATAFRGLDADAHVMPFTDMHDYGDMLVAAGFATPVVGMERLTLTYSDVASLWRDVRGLGGSPLQARHRGLRGRRYGQALASALDAGRDAGGRYALTFELIFAHAWKGEPRNTADGSAIVRFQRPSVQRPSSR